MERVKAKLESIKTWYFTIEQAVKLINSDVVPIADFLLQQDNSLDAAELVNKMIKNHLAENYKLNRTMPAKLWHMKKEHFGLGLIDMKVHHTKTFINNLRRHLKINDIHSVSNSTEIVCEIFREMAFKNPLTCKAFTRKEKKLLPNHIVKMAEIKHTMQLELIENKTDWKMISVTELNETLKNSTELIEACMRCKFVTLGDLFKRKKDTSIFKLSKHIKVEPKSCLISKVWHQFSTENTRTWCRIARAAERLINQPKIRLKKALLKQPNIELPQIQAGKQIVVATDGSYMNKEGGIGIVTQNNQTFSMKAFAPGSSFDCEIQAIYIALKMTPHCDKVSIITDSEASIRIISNERKTNNPYVKAIRKELSRINLIFVNSHQDIKKCPIEEREFVMLNAAADKAANKGRGMNGSSKAIPPLQELDDVLIIMDNQLVFDKIDHRLYNSIYEKEIAEANNYSNMESRKQRITPKQKIVTRNQINVAIRATNNSLPVLNKWIKNQGCSQPNCQEEENIPHAIFKCKELELVRKPLREELLMKLQNITQQPLNKIRKQFEQLTSNINPTHSPIYIGILPRYIYESWNCKGKTKEIQIEFIINNLILT